LRLHPVAQDSPAPAMGTMIWRLFVSYFYVIWL
jgi:hypothetical protein